MRNFLRFIVRVTGGRLLLALGLHLCACLQANAAETNSTRIVSLAPSLTELVYAMGFGDNLVGRSSACDFPPSVREVPVVGDFGRPNLERLQSVRPQIALVTDLEKPAVLDSMQDLGTRVLTLPCEGWSDMMSAARILGNAMEKPERSEQWISSMEARKTRLEQRVAASYLSRSHPRVYVEVWGDPLTTAGTGSFLDDLVWMAGGINIASEMKTPYPHLSSEWVIKENPDAIILAYGAGSLTSALVPVEKRLGWSSIDAVKDGRICTNIPPDLLLRPGPRMIDGAEALAAWLLNK